MKSYPTEHENYDDIYPSIVKQHPSYFKKVFLRFSFNLELIWNKICHSKKTRGCSH